MPPSWQYPRWRHILMQLVMVLTLAATTALAAFITHQRATANAVSLSQSQTVGPLTLRLPANWTITRSAGHNASFILRAQEFAPDTSDQNAAAPVRQLIVRLFPDDQNATSPADFLRNSGLLHGAMTDNSDSDDSDDGASSSAAIPATNIPVAGADGILVTLLRLQGTIDGQIRRVPEFLACGLLPGDRAIVLQLDSAEEDTDESSARLLAAIAASARVAPPSTAPSPNPADNRI